MFEDQCKESAYSKSVGSMRTDKPILSHPTCYMANLEHDFRVVSRPETSHPRFQQRGTYLVGKKNAQTNAKKYKQCFLPRTVSQDNEDNG
jgi:hypothetical protein